MPKFIVFVKATADGEAGKMPGADFGDALTPELAEREERMRAEVERRPQG